MNKILKQDILDFKLQKITEQELLNKLPFAKKENSIELRKIINNIIQSKIGEDVELGLTLLWLLEDENEFIDLIHKLLLEPWHSRYEDIIHDLQRRKDPASLPIIKIAIQNKYESLESYGTGIGQFISQCGYALYSIGNEDALNIIKELSNSENEQIKNEMLYQLKRHSNHPDTENIEITKRWWT